MPKCLSTHQYTSGTSRRKNRDPAVIAERAVERRTRAWSAILTPTPHKTEADAHRPDDDDRVAPSRQAFPDIATAAHAGWLRKLKARAARRWYPRTRTVLPALVVGARPAGVQVSTEGLLHREPGAPALTTAAPVGRLVLADEGADVVSHGQELPLLLRVTGKQPAVDGHALRAHTENAARGAGLGACSCEVARSRPAGLPGLPSSPP